MEIKIQRFDFTPDSTIGLLTIDGVFQCFTLEDAMRDEKIEGVTAIPPGIYALTYRDQGTMVRGYKQRYGPDHKMLWLRNVPDYQFVYFHVGNKPADTKGCILLGNTYIATSKDYVGSSRAAYEDFYPQVYKALDAEELVTVSVTVL